MAVFMPTQQHSIKLERTDERITRRTGLILVNRFGEKINLPYKIDQAFRAPGSNRGFAPSTFILSLVEMLIDGATYLEDIRLFEDDDAYKELAEIKHYPTSDAFGDWLRRHGGADGEQRLWTVTAEMNRTLTQETDLTLDIDTTIIESAKGDAVYAYEKTRGYNPLLGACTELGLFVGSRFQPGNTSPQDKLVPFITTCRQSLPGRISAVRIDTAGYNREVIGYCFHEGLHFTISVDHDSAVMAMVHQIPENEWIPGVFPDGTPAPYQVGETIHRFEHYKGESFRLVIKRSERKKNEQQDLFDGPYHYWIIATNIPHHERDAQAIIHFHQKRGLIERMIGELKSHFSMDHMPCGQIGANTLYFTTGILAFNLVQLLKRHYFGAEWRTKSVKSLRYYWLHLCSKVISHARYIVAKLAVSKEDFAFFEHVYLQLINAPSPENSSG
jgi:hypothetical protein